MVERNNNILELSSLLYLTNNMFTYGYFRYCLRDVAQRSGKCNMMVTLDRRQSLYQNQRSLRVMAAHANSPVRVLWVGFLMNINLK